MTRCVQYAAIFLIACNGYSGPDPTGTHTAASPIVVHYEPRPPGIPFDGNMPSKAIVEKEKDDVYKVSFGSCWAHVRRPKSPPTWKVIDGSMCSSNLAGIRITGGEMTVIEEGRMHFSFEGTAPDGKTIVKFLFTGGIKS
jgi:hypothetical protein